MIWRHNKRVNITIVVNNFAAQYQQTLQDFIYFDLLQKNLHVRSDLSIVNVTEVPGKHKLLVCQRISIESANKFYTSGEFPRDSKNEPDIIPSLLL